MVQRQGLRALVTFLSISSMVCILLSVFIPGINWFGKRKLVIFEDVEGNYIEITSIFTFGFLRTTQSIITEMDQEIFRQDGYHHWCDGITQDMPSETQRRLCELQAKVLISTLVYLALAFILSVTAVFARPRQKTNFRHLLYALACISLGQVVAGSMMGWSWIMIKNTLEEYFSTAYVEVNNLRMTLTWGWYLALFSCLAAAVVCPVSLYMACTVFGGYAEKAVEKGRKGIDKDLHPQPHRGTRVIPPTGEVQMRDLSPFTRHSCRVGSGGEGKEGEQACNKARGRRNLTMYKRHASPAGLIGTSLCPVAAEDADPQKQQINCESDTARMEAWQTAHSSYLDNARRSRGGNGRGGGKEGGKGGQRESDTGEEGWMPRGTDCRAVEEERKARRMKYEEDLAILWEERLKGARDKEEGRRKDIGKEKEEGWWVDLNAPVSVEERDGPPFARATSPPPPMEEDKRQEDDVQQCQEPQPPRHQQQQELEGGGAVFSPLAGTAQSTIERKKGETGNEHEENLQHLETDISAGAIRTTDFAAAAAVPVPSFRPMSPSSSSSSSSSSPSLFPSSPSSPYAQSSLSKPFMRMVDKVGKGKAEEKEEDAAIAEEEEGEEEGREEGGAFLTGPSFETGVRTTTTKTTKAKPELSRGDDCISSSTGTSTSTSSTPGVSSTPAAPAPMPTPAFGAPAPTPTPSDDGGRWRMQLTGDSSMLIEEVGGGEAEAWPALPPPLPPPSLPSSLSFSPPRPIPKFIAPLFSSNNNNNNSYNCSSSSSSNITLQSNLPRFLEDGPLPLRRSLSPSFPPSLPPTCLSQHARAEGDGKMEAKKGRKAKGEEEEDGGWKELLAIEALIQEMTEGIVVDGALPPSRPPPRLPSRPSPFSASSLKLSSHSQKIGGDSSSSSSSRDETGKRIIPIIERQQQQQQRQPQSRNPLSSYLPPPSSSSFSSSSPASPTSSFSSSSSSSSLSWADRRLRQQRLDDRLQALNVSIAGIMHDLRRKGRRAGGREW
ncbi:hypothetical protein VYU27_006873 [Nannochloropsis oceanica]